MVRNDNLAGSTANHFAEDHAESRGVSFTAYNVIANLLEQGLSLLILVVGGRKSN
ncbi:hypothetical protein ACFS07_16665 [Undibacterium arcticum]